MSFINECYRCGKEINLHNEVAFKINCKYSIYAGEFILLCSKCYFESKYPLVVLR